MLLYKHINEAQRSTASFLLQINFPRLSIAIVDSHCYFFDDLFVCASTQGVIIKCFEAIHAQSCSCSMLSRGSLM